MFMANNLTSINWTMATIMENISSILAEHVANEELRKKAEHPFSAHLTNNSSPTEIALVCLTCGISTFMRDLIMSWISDGKRLHKWIRFFIDAFSLGLSGIFCMTMFSDNLHDLHSLLFCIIGALLVRLINPVNQVKGSSASSISDSIGLLGLPLSQRRDFISYFRAYVNFAASVAILAVDFPRVFPVRFGKRQSYGTGLMDVGVGGYVVSYAMVSHEARGIVKTGRESPNKLHQIVNAIKKTIPMWILGLMRTLFLIYTGYHAHVTEYGVHWNFFLTLATVKVTSSIVLTVIPAKHGWIVSTVLMVAFQCIVQSNDISFRIFYGSREKIGTRETFLLANREGLASCFGYLAIYLASVSIGRYLALPRNTFRDWLKALLLLLLVDVVLWNVLANIMRHEDLIEPVSRRMANLPFVMWMMAHQLFLICAFFAVDLTTIALSHARLLHKSDPSEFCLMEAVNRNGLFYFVLANILVGVVNWMMPVTAYGVKPVIAYFALICYMFVLAVTCAILHMKNITLKFW